MPTPMKVCNTKDYNESLAKRGEFFSFLDDAIAVWFYKEANQLETSKFTYSDELIEILATVRYLLKYPLRQLIGLLKDWVINCRKLDLPIPDYTTVCRRFKFLDIQIYDYRTAQQKQQKGPVEVLIDSTGINIYHTDGGGSKKNKCKRLHHHYDQVRKLHIGMALETGDILDAKMTAGTGCDAISGVDLIHSIDFPISAVYADGAYDNTPMREACFESGAKQIIPPPRNAVIRMSNKKQPNDLYNDRNEAVRIIESCVDAEEGRRTWKEHVGYGKRSYVEGKFSTFKRIFGFHFMSKSETARANELTSKINLLNRFNQFKKPIFEKIIHS